MTQDLSREIVAYVRDKIERGLPESLDLETDLANDVDWLQMHEDDRLPSFLFFFCRDFEVSSPDWPSWKRRSEGDFLSKLSSFLSREGPDIQVFYNTDIPSLKIGSLVEMAHRKTWIL
ncbi:hypothetical protein [Litoreibacter meonggei]|uniref:hypothetical protein n=1 Tax=Litoreibacter meonggei TaxID=1049199 RepID=UPI001B87A3B8|nr:hypothetical protein [Litoreibacter meonggei]